MSLNSDNSKEDARSAKVHWSQVVPVLTLITVFVIFSFLVPDGAFLSERNLTNLARQVSVNCILAFGMTMIILLGAIDLSVGSVLALGSVVAGLMQVNMGLNQEGVFGAIFTLLGVMTVCGGVGAMTGGLISKFQMPPFVVTLGVFVIARGLALILSGGSKISPLGDEYRWVGTAFLPPLASLVLISGICLLAVAWLVFHKNISYRWLRASTTLILGGTSIWVFYGYQGIPIPVLLMVLVFGLIYFLLQKTVFGRSIYAVGGNREAARLCGIRVSSVIFSTYVIMGILISLATMIEGGRIDAGDPNAGNLYELDAIAAVVIGGTSLTGGVGRVTGTLLGAFLMGSVNNGMSLMNIPTNYQMVIKGLIIVSAVWMDVASKRRGR